MAIHSVFRAELAPVHLRSHAGGDQRAAVYEFMDMYGVNFNLPVRDFDHAHLFLERE